MAIIKKSFHVIFNKDQLNASSCQTFYQSIAHESPWKCSEGISGLSFTAKFWWFSLLCAVMFWQIWGPDRGQWSQERREVSGLGALSVTFAQGEIWSKTRARTHLGDKILGFFWDNLEVLWTVCLVGMRTEEIRWVRGCGAGEVWLKSSVLISDL